MANTKRTLRIMTTAGLDAAINVAGATDETPITLAKMKVTATDGAGVPTNGALIPYSQATAQKNTIDYSAILANATTDAHADGIDFELIIINVTGGREKFPRRTLTAPSVQGIIDQFPLTIEEGDGLTFTAAPMQDTNGDVLGTIEITCPDDVIIKVAASDGAVLNQSVAAVFHTGLTKAEAIEYAKDATTDEFGRTNRIKFPVVEPDFATVITAATYDLLIVTTVSDTKFDKNFAAGYHDVETFEFLMPAGTVTLPLVDAVP